MNNAEKTPNIVPFAIFTTITIVAWVFFDVYRNFTKNPPTTVPDAIVQDLNPNLDVSTLNSLSEKQYLPEDSIPDINTVSTATPHPASPTSRATASPTATSSASPMKTPEETL